jgi:hypothetical protein
VTGSDTKIGYCRVSAQASSCNRSEPLSFPGTGAAGDSGRPARAFIKVKRGRGPKKSISTTIRVCA